MKVFGTAQTVPAAMLSGVFKRHNLEYAQNRGLTLFWAHRPVSDGGVVARHVARPPQAATDFSTSRVA